MIDWSDVETGLDPVGLARRRWRSSRIGSSAGLAVAGEAAAVELLAAVGQDLRAIAESQFDVLVDTGGTAVLVIRARSNRIEDLLPCFFVFILPQHWQHWGDFVACLFRSCKHHFHL